MTGRGDSPSSSGDPSAEQQLLDGRCWQLEDAWRAGGEPHLSPLLEGCPPALRSRLLSQLLAIDVEYRLRAGEEPVANAYGELEGEVASVLPQVVRRVRRLLADDSPTRTNPPANSPPPKLPEPLGPYRFLSLLGSGGYGHVWRAVDTRIDREVAIKLPHRSVLTEHERERLHREARAVAQLDHPGIVPLIEADEADGRLYLVSRLVQGVSLRDWLQSNQPTATEVASLGLQLAEALEHAHGRRIVHRDVKPGNILIDADQRLHLTDFGMAKWLDHDSSMTQSAMVLGTPAYAAPEQARGHSREADERTDVYGLGVVLYELLTGDAPFRGTPQAILDQVLHREPERPRLLNATAPAELETITLKCLEKLPDQRYPSARAVADELQRFLSGHPIHARPVSAVGRAYRWAKRNRAVAASLAVTIASLLIGLAASTYFAIDAKRQATVARAETKRAQSETNRAEKASRLAASRLTEMERTAANRLLDSIPAVLQQNVFLARERLDQLAADNVPDGAAYHYYRNLVNAQAEPFLQLPESGKPYFLSGHPIFRNIAVSPDGRWLVAARGLTAVLDVWELETHDHVTTLNSGGHALTIVIAFAQDGSQLACGDTAGRVVLWRATEGWARQTVEEGATSTAGDDWSHRSPWCVRSLAFSPDGQRLAVGAHGQLQVYDLTGDRPVVEFSPERYGPIQALDWAKDGSELLIGTREGRADPPGQAVYRWAPGSKETLLRFASGSVDNLYDVRFSPSGQNMLTGYPDGLRVWDLEGQLLQKIDCSPFYISFSPEGGRFAIVEDTTVRVFSSADFAEVARLDLRRHLYPALHWANDGLHLLAFATGGEVFRWGIESSGLPARPWPADVQALPVAGPTWLGVSNSPTRDLLLIDSEGHVSSRLQPTPTNRTWRGEHLRVGRCAAPSGDWVAAITDRGSIRCWRTKDSSLLWSWNWERVGEEGLGWWSIVDVVTAQYQGNDVVVASVFGVAADALRAPPSKPTLVLIDPTTGGEVRRLATASGISGLLAYASSERILADWGRDGESDAPVTLVDMTTGEASKVLRGFNPRGLALDFDASGERLFASNFGGQLAYWDTATGTLHRRSTSLQHSAGELVASRDGSGFLIRAGEQLLFLDPVTLEDQGRVMAGGSVAQLLHDDSGNVFYRLRGSPGLHPVPLTESPLAPTVLERPEITRELESGN